MESPIISIASSALSMPWHLNVTIVAAKLLGTALKQPANSSAVLTALMKKGWLLFMIGSRQSLVRLAYENTSMVRTPWTVLFAPGKWMALLWAIQSSEVPA